MPDLQLVPPTDGANPAEPATSHPAKTVSLAEYERIVAERDALRAELAKVKQVASGLAGVEAAYTAMLRKTPTRPSTSVTGSYSIPHVSR